MHLSPTRYLDEIGPRRHGCQPGTRASCIDDRVCAAPWKPPQSMKIHLGSGKWALPELFGRYVPLYMIYRPKAGFDMLIGDWLRGPPCAHGHINSFLLHCYLNRAIFSQNHPELLASLLCRRRLHPTALVGDDVASLAGGMEGLMPLMLCQVKRLWAPYFGQPSLSSMFECDKLFGLMSKTSFLVFLILFFFVLPLVGIH